MAFSRYCLELRKRKELSQLELSEILGLSFSQLRNLEKERTKLPRPEVFQRLAEYLGKDVFDIAY
ncbi:MAG: helix-turn-helix transcriptional regulator, partial [Erysipelotrichaceae bacterium]|nr:helix-turn-helix transcriptional regulator [Erysipelotrichaceae bacterium]